MICVWRSLSNEGNGNASYTALWKLTEWDSGHPFSKKAEFTGKEEQRKATEPTRDMEILLYERRGDVRVLFSFTGQALTQNMVAISKYPKLINTMEELFKLQNDCWHNNRGKVPVKTLNGE